MKKWTKRVFAIFMAVAMMAAVSVTAFANETDPSDPNTSQEGGTTEGGTTEGGTNEGGSATATVADKTITVTGLTNKDKVKYYKVIGWDDVNGWQLVAPYNAEGVLTADEFASIKDGTLTQAIAAKIAAVSNTAIVPNGETVADTTWTKTNVDPGLYMVVAAPTSQADYVYNPVFVAVQANGAGGTIGTDDSYTGGAAKKSEVKVDKQAKSEGGSYDEWTTEDVGDVIDFKIETTIPVYVGYTNPSFVVTDSLSDGLTRKLNDESEVLSTITVKVKDGATLNEGTDYTVTAAKNLANGFEIVFTEDYLKSGTAAKTVEITYQAKITDAAKNVNPENNDVTIDYSRNPKDENDKGSKEDKTTHYTFDIDAELFGDTEYTTSEFVKVAVDENGDPLYEKKTGYSNKTEHAALAEAEFKLYKADGTTPYTNSEITADTVFTTDEWGRIEIKGLDEGDYVLKETKAPAGYKLNTTPVNINITATYRTVEATDTCNAYKELDKYEVTFSDGTTSTKSTYQMNQGTTAIEKTSDVAGDNSFEFKNTKGQELPSTGGIGTYVFTVAGVAIMAIAAGLLIVRHKKKAE